MKYEIFNENEIMWILNFLDVKKDICLSYGYINHGISISKSCGVSAKSSSGNLFRPMKILQELEKANLTPTH